MSISTHLSQQIRPLVAGALADGFRIFVQKPGPRILTPVNFAYACRDIDGAFAVINGSSNRLEPKSLAAPVRPHRDYGTSVLADYDGTIPDAMRALREICAADRVRVRFMGRNAAPVVPNYGRSVLERFSGGPGGFIELTAADLDDAEAPAGTNISREKELSHV